MRRVLPLLALAALPLLTGCSGGEEPDPDPKPTSACGKGPTQAAVITMLGFTAEEPEGVAPGFDIDGRASDTTDEASCGKQDYTGPDGMPGPVAGAAPGHL